ncbi:DNA internalization-related competence protein ComEC/Rec2 [Halalkalibacter alkaliphilus]|uniref:DNA internalization-related competence protein ComEC/Rec2 n=1 Tax=Halalkalibacter alkaliphilus TaxID=2917993 RepID=A0A9X2CR61_9BACI|nr:DNA internalization-related competence protein ComEC/Rec2 [Halalkalibacter alkaliphilus]
MPYLFILTGFLLFCLLHRQYFKLKILLFTFTFLIYYFVGIYTLDQRDTVFVAGEQTIYGKVQTIPVIDGDSLTMRLESNKKEVIQIQAYLYDEHEQKQMKSILIGDSCKISGVLSQPLRPTNFGQFDYKRYLYEQHIFWILRPNRAGIQCISTDHHGYFLKLQRWRQIQLQKIEQNISSDFSGIMSALVFGERIMMDGELLEAYQRLGVIHLLAVSGLHVGMIVAASFYMLIRIGVTRERSMEVLLFVLPIYSVIAGAAPSVIRAALMSMVVLLFMRMKLRIPPLLGIVVVYLAYVFYNPFIIFQLGFQLSFLVSFSLITSAPIIQRRYNHTGFQLVAITMVSQLISFPIILLHMYEIPILSLPLNVVYIPFISLFVLPLTFISFFISFFLPTNYNVFLYLLEAVVPTVHQILLKVAELKWATLIVGKPSTLMMFLFYISIVYGFVSWEKGGKLWWRIPLLFLSLILLFQLLLPYTDSRAKITMIDVGQGDSFLIELPYRKAVYLIDTGGTISFMNEEWRSRRRAFDVGANIVVPTLKAQGIRKVDRLILTHGHRDHIGGAKALAQGLTIKEVLYSKGPVEGEFERDLLTVLSENGATIHFINEGMGWSTGDSSFSILSPVGTEPDLNARSIVILANVEEVSILFTGDLEEEGERRLLRDYPELQVDILKIGHHGSRTSTTEPFLQQLRPKAAFIPVGRNNRFGHPHPDVMSRLEEQEVIIWRSDLNGAVQLLIKNKELNIRTPKGQ